MLISTVHCDNIGCVEYASIGYVAKDFKLRRLGCHRIHQLLTHHLITTGRWCSYRTVNGIMAWGCK